MINKPKRYYLKTTTKYYENPECYWAKSVYDNNGYCIYHETSNGYIRGKR